LNRRGAEGAEKRLIMGAFEDAKGIEIAYRLTYGEVICKDGCPAAPMHWTVLAAWERLRRALRVPIAVNSAYRTAAYNRHVGGSPKSQHLEGRAMDLQCASIDLSTQEMLPLLIECGFRGIGGGWGWVHVDTRDGAPSFWRYTAGGQEPDLAGRMAWEEWKARQ
jgi:hypothetical protein